jgi:mRNA interferase MazF
MTAGDIALTPLPQADGRTKPRPVVLLRRMPPFGDWLVCGVSSQIQQAVAGFDEVVLSAHPDFHGSGLKVSSVIRLGFLAVFPSGNFLGPLGAISPERHARLLQRLSAHLVRKENN